MRAVALLVACVLVATVSTAAAESREIKKDFDQTFQVSQGASLHVNHGDGDVTVVPWEKDEVRVVVHYDATVRIGGVWRQTDFDVEFRHEGEDIHVVGHEPGASGFGWIRRTVRKYVYEISAPAYTRLIVNGDDGDVVIRDWAGDINCTLDDGDVHIDGANCERVHVTVEDGDVDLSGVNADLRVSSDDGDITLDGCRTPSCRIRVADGDVLVTGCGGSFDVSLDDGDLAMMQLESLEVTVSCEDGDIMVGLAHGGAVDVDITTDDGDATLRLHPETSAMVAIAVDDGGVKISHSAFGELEKTRHRVTGRIGAGEGSVRIRTADGDVVIGETK